MRQRYRSMLRRRPGSPPRDRMLSHRPSPDQAQRTAARSAAIRAACAARQTRDRRRRADRNYKSGRSAVALRVEGIEVFEQAVLTERRPCSSSRHCERSEAIHVSECEVTMDCFVAFAPRNDVDMRFAISRHIVPEVCIFVSPRNQRAQGSRVLAAPAVSCAMCTRKCAHEHTGTAGALRPSLRKGEDRSKKLR